MTDDINYFPSHSFKFIGVGRPDIRWNTSIEFDVSHNNGKTTLTERLKLVKYDNGKWGAIILLDTATNLIKQADTPTEAAKILSAQLTKMAESILLGEFDTVDFVSL